MSYQVIVNVDRGTNLIRGTRDGGTVFCLKDEFRPFGYDLFVLESVPTGMNVPYASSGIRYRVKWVDNGRYLFYDNSIRCFSLTTEQGRASVWQDRENNKSWTISTPTGSGSSNVSLEISILPARECTANCNEDIDLTCNYLTGNCEDCPYCEGTCKGTCPTGFECQVVGREYKCVEKDTTLRNVLIIVGILVLFAVVFLLAYFASK